MPPFIDGIPSGEYIAISHVWGPSSTYTHNPETDIPGLRQNSGSMLPNNIAARAAHVEKLLQLAGYDIPIWMDCVSINQTDAAAISAQVAVMGRIYSDCMHCLVYDQQIFDGIHKMMLLLKSFNENWENWSTLAEPMCEVAFALESSEYFDRAWTFQEWKLPGKKKLFASSASLLGDVSLTSPTLDSSS